MTESSQSTLDQLAVGERAQICAVLEESATARRMMALGFVPGTDVVVLRRSPLGDPTEYELRGTRIALRRAEARLMQIERRG